MVTCFCHLFIFPEYICTRNIKVVFLWAEKSRKSISKSLRTDHIQKIRENRQFSAQSGLATCDKRIYYTSA
jgi:hypothetical protein